MVLLLSGPGTNFTNFGLVGSVTSRIVQPRCHSWPMKRYHLSFARLMAILNAPPRPSRPLYPIGLILLASQPVGIWSAEERAASSATVPRTQRTATAVQRS